jgi:DNA-3-methyladenine glycosylase
MRAGSYPSSACPEPTRRLTRDELPVDTAELARFLIGKTLVRELPDGARLLGRIVETEAYVPGDAASHAFRGQTRRNRTMFGERGHAYVYISYGCWPMLNVVSETTGTGAGVLLRALEPISGIERMNPGRTSGRAHEIARGPGRLATAMHITLALDGTDLCAPGKLWLGTALRPAGEIGVAKRIGITKEADRLLRFFERGNPAVSGPKWMLAG